MRFLRSAFKHGVAEDDIHHALRNEWFIADGDIVIVVGPDTRGRLLEVGIRTEPDGETTVIHAMPARRKFLR